MRRTPKKNSNRFAPKSPQRDAVKSRPSGTSERAPKGRWVIGLHAVEEVLRVRPKDIAEVWIREDYQRSSELKTLHERLARGKKVYSKPVGALDKLGSGHQGIAISVSTQPELDWDQLAGEEPMLLVALDGIEDPQNLGSMIRTCWLAGVRVVLIPQERAVGLTPTVCKVASGGAEHVAVEAVSNLPDTLKSLKDQGFWIYGMAESGNSVPWNLKLPKKIVWVIGSEGSGMRITTERACDEVVKIPQVDSGSSYNASVALAMVLFETLRQQDLTSN